MIVIETKLKVLPKKCNKCKYSYLRYDDRFCAVSFINGVNRICPYEYNESKRNCEYGKPDWCPLKEIDKDGSCKEEDVWSTNPWENYEKQGCKGEPR